MKNQLYETARVFHDEGNVEKNIGKMIIRSFLGELNLLYICKSKCSSSFVEFEF